MGFFVGFTFFLIGVMFIICILIEKVVRLMDEVESIFTKHFANNDRKKAMKFLRPQQNKESHMVTFFVGKKLSLSLSLPTNYQIVIMLSNSY